MIRQLRSSLALAASLALSAGCYHAVVETGRPAGTTVVQQPWVRTFVFGLVSAPEIDVSAQCRTGVARVETQQTFMNGLAGALTFGIFTPLSATVTCAADGRGAVLPGSPPTVAGAPDATPAEQSAALRDAAKESARLGQPVFVRF